MKHKKTLLLLGLSLACAGLMAAECCRLELAAGESMGVYLFQALFAAGMGALFSLGLRRPWFLLPAFGLALLSAFLGGWDAALLRDMATALWPLAVTWLAVKVNEWAADWRKQSCCWFYGGYYLLVFGGIVLLRYRTKPWLSFEPVGTLALLLMALAALWSPSSRELYYRQVAGLVPLDGRTRDDKLLRCMLGTLTRREAEMRRARLWATLAAAALALLSFCQQGRIWDILFGRTGLGEWLDWRMEMLRVNFTGDFSGQSPWFWGLLLERCPLSHLGNQEGLWPVLGMLALMAPVYVLLFALLRETRAPHCRGLALCLGVKGGLGLLADGLLVVSSTVRPLLMVEPWDLCALSAFMVLLFQKSNKPLHAKREGACDR